MTSIILDNHHPASDYDQVSFDTVNNQACLLKNERILSTISSTIFFNDYVQFFSNPILNATLPSLSEQAIHLEYDDLRGLFSCIKQALLAFSYYGKGLKTIRIKPTAGYQKKCQRKFIPFIIDSSEKIDLSITQFNQLIHLKEGSENYHYSEAFIVDVDISTDNLLGPIKPDAFGDINELLDEKINTGKEPVTIKFFDKKVGFGIFASRDIKQGEIVSFYNGRYHPDDIPLTDYTYNLRNDLFNKYLEGRYEANLARYINHTSNDDIIKFCERSGVDASLVQSDNLISHTKNYGGIDFIFLVAKNDIAKGAQLLFDYCPAYWEGRAPAFVFLKDGDCLEPDGNKIQANLELPTNALRLLSNNGGVTPGWLLLRRPLIAFVIVVLFFCLASFFS